MDDNKDKKQNLNEDDKNRGFGCNPHHGRHNKDVDRISRKQGCGCGCHEDMNNDSK